MLRFLDKKRTFKCTSEKDMNIVTQPDLSRTIRQIMEDAVIGKPSPQALQPLPHDATRPPTADVSDIHSKCVILDKFEAIDEARKITKNKYFTAQRQQNELTRQERNLQDKLEAKRKEKENPQPPQAQ